MKSRSRHRKQKGSTWTQQPRDLSEDRLEVWNMFKNRV